MNVPQASPGLRYERYRSEIDAALRRVLESGRYVLGREVDGFEREFAAYLGAGHVVGVASGTDALSLALDALGVGPGDDVLVPALTAPPTAVAVARLGARPVFVDVEAGTRGLDPARAAAAVTPRTRAMIAVHLHGIPARVEELLALAQRLGLALVEDCAQSHGARVAGRRTGTFGHAAAFSFYPTKNLGALGDGGCVATGDAALAARVRRRREYGWDANRTCIEPGFNSRLDELQAAVLRALLPSLDDDNARRARLAARYDAALGSRPGLRLPPRREGSVYHQYAIEADARDTTAARLANAGIGTAVHYPLSLHRHPAFSSPGEFPVAERLAATLLSLPIQPELEPHAARVIEALA
jgi:dTDP-3-amino-3,4,6-trideoxy-alpha-D-glucose transaminase